jgi:hypothetical protein
VSTPILGAIFVIRQNESIQERQRRRVIMQQPAKAKATAQRLPAQLTSLFNR